MKLSLSMIVKGTAEEAVYLEQALESTKGVFDEIVLVANAPEDVDVHRNVRKVAKKFKAKYFERVWKDDFADQRNYSFSKCTGDVIFWMDTDDVIDKPKKLREVAELMTPLTDAVYLEYLYELDETGAVKTTHWRERLIRNNGAFFWKGRLHETLIEVRRAGKVKNDEVKIVHTAKDDRRDSALERNIRILQEQLKDEADKPDARTIFYLAACYKDAGMYDQSLELYRLYVTMSGWDEERSQAYCQMARILYSQDKKDEAINCYIMAIKENPDNVDAYCGMAETYLVDEKFSRALNWAEKALSIVPKETMTVMNPLATTYRPLLIFAEASFNEGKIEQAINAVKKAKSIRDDELTSNMLETFREVQGHKLAAQAFSDIIRFMEHEKEDAKIVALLNEAIPASLLDNPLILNARKKFIPPVSWPKKSVAIFTGQSVLGEWGPWSLAEGIGGSEEAIVRLSKQLVKQGYQVTVFASPGHKAGDYEGVTWKNYWEVDLRDTFDVFIAWRSPWFFDAKVNARKKYLWLHDVMDVGEFTSERLMNLDKVIVLSQYHRSLFPAIPDNKILISANGIDAEEFAGAEKSVRNPHKMVYMSANERGLARLLDLWPSIITEIPDAELHVMYGWNSFMAVNKDNPERMSWMQKMKQRVKALDGVTDHGKVGHDEVVKHITSAGLWVYPTAFPEISCITAMKAQAGGAVPVTSDFAALAETVQYGKKMNLGEFGKEEQAVYKEAVVKALQDEKWQAEVRKEMIPGAQQQFSWANVASQWIGDFEK